jgi:hypothetical protein
MLLYVDQHHKDNFPFYSYIQKEDKFMERKGKFITFMVLNFFHGQTKEENYLFYYYSMNRRRICRPAKRRRRKERLRAYPKIVLL